MPLDLTLSVAPEWGVRTHHLYVARTIDAGAPAYVLRLVPAGAPNDGFAPVADPLRFGFYQGDWWRLEGDHEDNAGPDLLTLDPVWGLRNHHSIIPLRHYAGSRLMPGLKLIITEPDDPRRFGTFRNSTWRLAGDE